jgi:hypothetical protein
MLEDSGSVDDRAVAGLSLMHAAISPEEVTQDELTSVGEAIWRKVARLAGDEQTAGKQKGSRSLICGSRSVNSHQGASEPT